MTTVQLLITDEGNRTALESVLADQYTVIESEALQEVDCYVIDDQSLPAYQDTLEAHKQACHPTFCPVVLIRREETRISVSSPDSTAGPPLIDETVTAPIDKPVLVRRIENLAVRREQSVTLTQQYERVEARFQALFDAIPDPAFVLDTDGSLAEVNDEFCRAFGTDRETVRGQPLGVVDGLDLDSDRVVAGRLTGPIEYTNAAGIDRYATLSTQSVTVEGEQYTVGIVTDVTELNEKTERLEEFANVLAHDLRNPLQVARMRLSVLREEFPTAGTHFDSIDVALDRIQDLNEKLLAVAKTGQTDAEMTELHLRDRITDAWERVETVAATLDVAFPEEATIQADREQLRELFEMLFQNAVEHGSTSNRPQADDAVEHGGESVTVEVGLLSEGFYVEDDGSGIPEQKRQAVFRMGYSTHTNGNGLGLNIAAEIADSHDWELSVAEGSEGGARFEITGATVSGPDQPET